MRKEKPSEKLTKISAHLDEIRRLNLQLATKLASIPTIDDIVAHIEKILFHYYNLVENLIEAQERFEEEYIPKFEEE
jgi:hypothetical protein